ncbi:MAG: NFACT RNA binding domain-containing protein [Treponema sp.]|jgi:predicted ribosome quality control (RQC) complex YloA/Tae2 family protein|nr:NFACT RNA binding domain-containing protein [Treponema sp.]
MSLNWKEINLILEELDLQGAQIQSAVQSAFDVIILRLHGNGKTKQLLVSLSSGACRIHETFRAAVKSEKPLRFAQFLSSKIVNGRITEICQLGDNRIVRVIVKRPDAVYRLYIRLWSNAANFIVTDEDGVVLDAMRRLPKRGEVTGGHYSPEDAQADGKPERDYEIRELPGSGSFNERADAFYAAQGGSLSLEALREQARRGCEGSLGRINAALGRLREKEASFAGADRLKFYGDLILSNIANIKPGDKWLETEYEGEKIRIELEPRQNFRRENPAAMAGTYYEQYRKAKNGLEDIRREIAEGERELKEVTDRLERLLGETNPLILAKLLKAQARPAAGQSKKDTLSKRRPGLAFKRGDWLIVVGRDSGENDELLRRHVKGNDLWLHARDYHGSYVFIKQRSGKTVPLDILLDAGNLAVFYSKGRNNREGDLFYTHVKYLRRAKNSANGKVQKGLVIPTQEKNLHIKLDDARLRALENCKV